MNFWHGEIHFCREKTFDTPPPNESILVAFLDEGDGEYDNDYYYDYDDKDNNDDYYYEDCL